MNDFARTNDFANDIAGTSLRGHITATYAELVVCFGTPDEGDGYKTDAEWAIKFADGKVATIYNWKNGPNYGCGDSVNAITNWNIGGRSDEVVRRVEQVLESYRSGKTVASNWII